jgi:hypothetical protein
MIGLCFPCQEKGILRAPYKDVNGKPMLDWDHAPDALVIYLDGILFRALQ